MTRLSLLCGALCLGLALVHAAPLPQPLAADQKTVYLSLALRHDGGEMGLTLDGSRHLTKPVFLGVNGDGRLRARVGEDATDGQEPLPETARLVARIERLAGNQVRLSALACPLTAPVVETWSLTLTGMLPEEGLREYFLDLVNGGSGQFLDVAFGSSWNEVTQPLAGALSGEGHSGGALDARSAVATAPGQSAFSEREFSLDLWAKLRHDGSYNILVANAPKSSDTHWELYTERGNGALAAYLPANRPAVLTSPHIVTDDRWHRLGLVADATMIRLFVDGEQVLEAPHTRGARQDARDWGLAVGALHERSLRCNGLIDEVRLTAGGKPVAAWSFDQETGGKVANGVPGGAPLTLESVRPGFDYPTVRQRIEPAVELFAEAEVAQLGVAPRAGVLRHWGEQYRELTEELAGRRQPPAGAAEQVLDPQALVQPDDGDPAGVVLRRTRALLDALVRQYPEHDFTDSAGALARLETAPGDRHQLYLAACALRRQIMLRHPLLDFDHLLFVKRGTYAGSRLTKMQNRDPEGGHFANQYFGFNTIPDGGLYVLEGLHGTPQVRELPTGGSVEGPDLSFDGQEIVFARSEAQEHTWQDWSRNTTWNLCRMQADGSGLRQLTDSAWNDFDPCWLPDGRIAFVSERRGGYIRCFGSYIKVPNYVLHAMAADGTGIVPLSYYETSEWNPSVDNHGMLVYGRWDYTDRENCLGSNFWTCYPDGRNPRAPHGNYPYPWHTFPSNPPNLASHTADDTRTGRPYAEMGIRAIPGSRHYLLVGAPHHGEAFGSLCQLDLSLPDDGAMGQLRRITPYVPFPETESPGRSQYPYGTPWPLGEDLYLANYWEDLVVLDRFGNQELLGERELVPGARDDRFRLTDPIPLRARPQPPVIPVAIGPDLPSARITVANVYDTDIPLPPGTKIKYLRVLQNFLKTNHAMGQPMGGYQNEAVPRMPLGLVPVAADGSAHFLAPPGKELIFQLVDEDFMAVQTMRSVAFVHPGEHLSCAGCHEPTQSSPVRGPRGLQATVQEPARPAPELARLEPISYYRQVKPLVESTCLPCHRQHEAAPQKLDYADLEPYVLYFAGGMSRTTTKPLHGGSRSIPGMVGARASRLGQAVLAHRDKNRIPEDAYRTVVLWLDANAPRLTALHREQDQLAGELVWPKLDVDPQDPLGLQGEPGENTPARIAACAALQHPAGPERLLGTTRRILTSDHTTSKVYVVGPDGQIEWEYACDHPQDVWWLPNGHVLVAWYRAVQEIVPDWAAKQGGEVVWEYRVEAPDEIPACQPLPDGRVLVGVCGPCELREVDRTGAVVQRVKLQSQAKLHGQFRFCRKTPQGTYLVPFLDEHKVQEVDAAGAILHEIAWPHPVVTATRLPDGHTLVGGGKLVREYDADWQVVWELGQDDLGYQLELGLIAGVRRLPDGNTLIANYGMKGDRRETAMAFEITPDYRIVWRLWNQPPLGSLAQIQMLGPAASKP